MAPNDQRFCALRRLRRLSYLDDHNVGGLGPQVSNAITRPGRKREPGTRPGELLFRPTGDADGGASFQWLNEDCRETGGLQAGHTISGDDESRLQKPGGGEPRLARTSWQAPGDLALGRGRVVDEDEAERPGSNVGYTVGKWRLHETAINNDISRSRARIS